MNSETLETYWKGIEIGDNANIFINGAHFNGMSDGKYRENSEENYSYNANISIKNSIFENNFFGIKHSIMYEDSGDYFIEGQLSFIIENCTFINSNIILYYCLSIGCESSQNNVSGSIFNNIFHGADFTYFLTLGQYYGGYNLYYDIDYYYNTLQSDLLDINPNFVDVNFWNYQLQWDNFPNDDETKSPCIDAGNPDSPNDPDGTRVDIGAFYFNQLIGDVNSDGEISILDIPVFVNYILGNPNPNFNFQFHVFDLNQDGIINITDVLALINIILANNSIVNNATTTYLSGIIEAMENGQRYKYNIDMLNEQDVYILHFELQFDNKIPLHAIKGIRSDEMRVNYNIIAEEYKINIMIFSPEGRKIPVGYGTIVEIELETTGLGRDGELTDGSEFIITDLANNPETLIPVEIVSADELSRLADEKLNYIIPEKFALHPVFPNPFNPIATIRYDLPKETQVSLMVYDLNGRQIATLINSNQTAGIYSVNWHAEHLSSGAYFIKMKTESYTKTQKVILVK
ncbi:MAG: T9SS type A sorting domain-containing protein [Candidatus Marinimicrobia bacterium]|nr:T9SS type A sorting domain-containing protein [Candidatus Neomarinimicrobiota bacterium]